MRWQRLSLLHAAALPAVHYSTPRSLHPLLSRGILCSRWNMRAYGLLMLVVVPIPSPAQPVAAERVWVAMDGLAEPRVPLPPQPFTVELLDLRRGQWHFSDALGQRLDLDGPVPGYAFPGATPGGVRLGYLCCDPEFPEDLTHAVLKAAPPTTAVPEATWFRIDEPYFAAAVEVAPLGEGVLRCRLHDLSLGAATTGDR